MQGFTHALVVTLRHLSLEMVEEEEGKGSPSRVLLGDAFASASRRPCSGWAVAGLCLDGTGHAHGEDEAGGPTS